MSFFSNLFCLKYNFYFYNIFMRKYIFKKFLRFFNFILYLVINIEIVLYIEGNGVGDY